jgi:hypothetical protein
MDQVTVPRAVAQQALEALEELNGWQSLAPPLASQAGRQAAINLRAALEQKPKFTLACGCPSQYGGVPAEWPVTTREGEPATAYGVICGRHWYEYGARCPNCASLEAQNTELDRKLAALEKPERAQAMRDAGYTRRPTLREMAALEQAEPVAWRTFDGEGGYDYRTYDDNENYRDEWGRRNPNHKGWVEPLYTHPPCRELLTVTDLQQALVDTDLVDPDAIDDPEGFDNGFTLQQIDALHSRLMQTTPPTTTTQPEPK